MALEMTTDIQYLKGIGEKRAALFRKLGITTIDSLLSYYPRSYIDMTNPTTVQAASMEVPCAIRATVLYKSSEQHIRKGLTISKAEAIDSDGNVFGITFFNGKFTLDKLKLDNEYIFYGKISGTILKREMNTPMVIQLSDAGTLLPIYPLTAGLTGNGISTAVKNALKLLEERIPETLPKEILQEYKLCGNSFALQNIHFPTDLQAMYIARKRLIFEELFTLSVALSYVRQAKQQSSAVGMHCIDLSPFYKSLPFTLTDAQLRAIGDVTADLQCTKGMNRLVQGDVGSGKTAVAAAACYFAAKNSMQSAMMAPTEILAEQHYHTLQGFLEPLGVKVGLLTGSMKIRDKNLVKQKLAAGEYSVLVGTHALISAGLEFENLGLVITDEQHRFGVNQRIALSKKGQRPHTLVMSATPIPRTLALMIYGDLDISVIDAMPLGRLPVKTYAIDSGKRQRAYNFIKSYLDKGMQGYIVCPLVEIGDSDLGLTPATEYAEEISAGAFCGYHVGLLHGKMKPTDKESTMRKFKNGEIQLLVATTVIEVGVDVPNAVIMLIENAERFGLSQLHQLRGRIGRGNEQAHCILLSDSKGAQARARLRTMCKTSSGFEIAEQDLAMRGPGDFFGSRQHGLPQLAIADMAKDITLLSQAQDCAKAVLNDDPLLKKPQYRIIKDKAQRMLSDIGERPN